MDIRTHNRQAWDREGKPVGFSHTQETQIGGQLEAGLLLAGFYKDRYPGAACDRLSYCMATLMATRAIKL